MQAELEESRRVLQSQEQLLLAPRAAARLAEENSDKRAEKLVEAIELSSSQVSSKVCLSLAHSGGRLQRGGTNSATSKAVETNGDTRTEKE